MRTPETPNSGNYLSTNILLSIYVASLKFIIKFKTNINGYWLQHNPVGLLLVCLLTLIKRKIRW